MSQNVNELARGNYPKLDHEWIQGIAIGHCPYCTWGIYYPEGEYSALARALDAHMALGQDLRHREAYEALGSLFI